MFLRRWYGISILHYVRSQKSADLIYSMVEAWKPAWWQNFTWRDCCWTNKIQNLYFSHNLSKNKESQNNRYWWYRNSHTVYEVSLNNTKVRSSMQFITQNHRPYVFWRNGFWQMHWINSHVIIQGIYKKKKGRTVPFLCKNLSIIFGEKLLILQDRLCDLSRNIFRWYKACSEAVGQHSEAVTWNRIRQEKNIL